MEQWSLDRVERLVKSVHPEVASVAATFPSAGVIRVMVYSMSIRGLQPRIKALLEDTLPIVVKRVEVLVAKGTGPAKDPDFSS